MKKLTTTIVQNDEAKEITVWVDEETAAMLETVSEEDRKQYLAGEYEIELNNRKETRRHQSLDKSMENGFEFEDNSPTPEEFAENCELSELLDEALSILTEKQCQIFLMVAIDNRNFTDIAEEMGISKQAVRVSFENSKKKIQKVFGSMLSKWLSRGY